VIGYWQRVNKKSIGLLLVRQARPSIIKYWRKIK